MKSRIAILTIGAFATSMLVLNNPLASAATKTITCYKGTAVKKVTAVTPKCITGWSTKKPVVKVTPNPTASTKSLAFSGTYKGKMNVLWSDSGVQVTSVSATGSGSIFSLATLTGTGSSAPQSQCDGIDGSGVLGIGADTVKVVFDSTTKGCAADGTAPTVITISGNATIAGGTGKYAGATGSLKTSGSFAIKSKDAGFEESLALTLTLIGTITTK
jgi:hypothetical protein